jgi:hypothetical protein
MGEKKLDKDVPGQNGKHVVGLDTKAARPWGTPVSGTPVHPDRFWQARFYDFNVWTKRKRIEKLRYIHRNPVERGLVLHLSSGAGAVFDGTSAER